MVLVAAGRRFVVVVFSLFPAFSLGLFLCSALMSCPSLSISLVEVDEILAFIEGWVGFVLHLGQSSVRGDGL